MTFHGEPCHASLSADDRHNLPDQVTPGTPYRDVLVRYALATSIAPPPQEKDRSTGPAQVPESCGTVASGDPVARR
ncbi:hypothetical protein SAMN06297387_103254 [Streptomyces zhaozhouensis]|uniref:Uncharacterized protein n=1 Tax=Streptomyces zhaozhouensis TaxID=1300267 RepID=A0A286DSE9_9ACTN|nr:hypothetical protein [Streptomyces zhaozhouensis]SOD61602.1 hypothetical protein SAMN06297387_103254 [Streptomyces zhaozhouensis]